MLRIAGLDELRGYLGGELGVSDWLTVDQPMIDRFAEVTGDRHWVHTDVARAARETPMKSTIAHGFLTLSLVTGLSNQIFELTGCTRFVNYGLDRVRFTNPVLPGAQVRLRLGLKEAEAQSDGAIRLVTPCVLEIAGQERPALVADFIFIAYRARTDS